MKEKKKQNYPFHEQLITFSETLFVIHGGVLDYTDNLALQLCANGKLKTAIAPEVRYVQRPYQIEEFRLNGKRRSFMVDRFKAVSKIVTLFYFIRLYRSIFFEVKRIARKYPNATILFTEYYTHYFDIIIACARWQKIPYAIVFHGLDLIWANQKHFLHFRTNYKKSRFVIYNSRATENLCRNQFGFTHKKELILHPGLNVSDIQKKYSAEENIRNQGSGKEEQIVFATVSRLVKRKGINLAIQIVHELKKSNRDLNIQYYIAGVGEEKESLEQLIEQLQAGSYIKMLGSITEEEKFRLLQRSDFFLLPNHSAGKSDFEGFGISFIEASLLGNVIIGGSHGGASEAVQDRLTGYLFDFDKPESVEQAVKVITDCLNNPALMNDIKKQGTEFVRHNYDWNELAKKFINFLNT